MADYFCKFFKETVKTLEQPQLFVGCRNHNHHGYNPPPPPAMSDGEDRSLSDDGILKGNPTWKIPGYQRRIFHLHF